MSAASEDRSRCRRPDPRAASSATRGASRAEVERRRQVVGGREPAARLGAVADAAVGAGDEDDRGRRASPAPARSSSANAKPSPSARRVSTTTTSGRRVPTSCAWPRRPPPRHAGRTRRRAAPSRSGAAAPRRFRRSGHIRPCESARSVARLSRRVGRRALLPAMSASQSPKGPLAAIVLAAGKGTRMRSSRAKVLHELLGRPLVCYPIELARALGADPVVAVLGHQHEAVEAALLARFGAGAVTVVEQTEQTGTGHAVPPGDAGAGADGGRDGPGRSTATFRSCGARRSRSWSGRRGATAAWRWSPRRRPTPPAMAASCATSAGT